MKEFDFASLIFKPKTINMVKTDRPKNKSDNSGEKITASGDNGGRHKAEKHLSRSKSPAKTTVVSDIFELISETHGNYPLSPKIVNTRSMTMDNSQSDRRIAASSATLPTSSKNKTDRQSADVSGSDLGVSAIQVFPDNPVMSGTSNTALSETAQLMQVMNQFMKQQQDLLKRSASAIADNADPPKRRKTHVMSDSEQGELSEDDRPVEEQIEELLGDLEKSANADNNNNCSEVLKDSDSVNEEWLLLAKEYQVEEETGPKLDDKLADLLKNLITNKSSDERLKAKMEAYPKPQNCEPMQAPRINPEIWSKLKPGTRSRDIKMQRSQTKLMKALIPLAQMMQSLLKSEHKALVRIALDSATLICSASQDISQRRRELIKPDLNAQFAQLASSHIPVGNTYLSGDDLPKTVKDINETNRVGYKLSGISSRGRGGRFLGGFNPSQRYNNRYQYNNQQYNFSRRGNFGNRKPYFVHKKKKEGGRT